jgi:hypothetical protein
LKPTSTKNIYPAELDVEVLKFLTKYFPEDIPMLISNIENIGTGEAKR